MTEYVCKTCKELCSWVSSEHGWYCTNCNIIRMLE